MSRKKTGTGTSSSSLCPFVPSIQQMFTVLLCLLAGDSEGESLGPQPRLIGGRVEVQRVQNEELDCPDVLPTG